MIGEENLTTPITFDIVTDMSFEFDDKTIEMLTRMTEETELIIKAFSMFDKLSDNEKAFLDRMMKGKGVLNNVLD